MEKVFVYIWEYLVKENHLTAFKNTYGPKGEWVQLFKNGKGYIATDLHQDINNPNRFVTVDYWTSKLERDNFRERFSKEFKALDESCDRYTEKETLLGDFNSYTRILLVVIMSLTVSLGASAQDSLDNNDTPLNELPAPDNSKRKGLKDKIQNLGIGKGVRKTKDNMAISVALQQARLAELQKRYLPAITHYKKVVDLHAGLNEQQEVTDYSQKIAWLYLQAGKTKEALDQYQYVLERKETSGDTTNLSEIRHELSNLQPEQVAFSLMPLEIPVEEVLTQEETENESERLKTLAENTESSQDYKQSLEYFKLYTELENQQKQAEQAQQLALQEKTFELEKQAQQMSLLRTEKEVQTLTLAQQKEQLINEKNFKRNLLVGVILLTLAVLATLLLYRGKRKALGELNLAYGELNTTKDKLVNAEEELKNLLDQQVSRGVAQQLRDHKADQGQKKFVCVMFLDIRGFTPFAERMQPEELIKYQNDVFGLMINIIDNNQGVINQFLGDGFMATFGLQDNQAQVCDSALEAAIEIINIVNKKSESGDIPTTRVGIGLHAGNVVAGNVGTSIRKQYSITGNTVITAARIEQLNKKFESQLLISREVHDQLSHPEKLPQQFVNAEVKGRKRPIELLKIA